MLVNFDQQKVDLTPYDRYVYVQKNRSYPNKINRDVDHNQFKSTKIDLNQFSSRK